MPSTPLSHWIGFHLALLLLLAAELLYVRRTTHSRHTKSIVATTMWVAAALSFAVYLHYALGAASALQYIAGYALEESLSVDNLFVFLLLFGAFRIDRTHQPKVLFWGVAGAILMRGLFIAGGLSLLARFAWVGYVFAVFLLVAAARLLFPGAKPDAEAAPGWLAWLHRIHPVSNSQDHFVVVETPAGAHKPRWMPTVLLLTLVAIELTDVVFALDSIPAVLSITRNPFLAYSSNIMAVMGLRSLYFLLIQVLTQLRFLHLGIATLLAFAAFKMLAGRWIEIGPIASLAFILAVLGITCAASLLVKAPETSAG